MPPALTAKDVARASGVSTATVSRVLNNDRRISAETSRRVREVVASLGYEPNPFARGLKTSRSLTIGFLAPEFTNEFFMGIAEGVEERLRQDRFHLVIGNSRESPDEEKARLHLLLDRGVDGLIVIPSGSSGTHLAAATSRGVPVVLVDRLVEGFQADAVLVDNVNGTYQALELLLKEGFTRIGFIGGDQRLTSARERWEGYQRALDDYRVPVDPDLVRFGDFHRDSGYRLTGDLMGRAAPPEALFVSNYFMHIGATRWLMEHRSALAAVPALVSFDDLELSFSLDYCRAVVRQPVPDIGRQAAEFLLSRVAGTAPEAFRLARLKTQLVLKTMQSIAQEPQDPRRFL